MCGVGIRHRGHPYNGGVAWCQSLGLLVYVGKGLYLAWLTLGGLGGAMGSKPMYVWVSSVVDGDWCDSNVSGDDCCVSTESEVSSAGSTRGDGSRERMVRLGTVTEVGGCFLRCSLCGIA